MEQASGGEREDAGTSLVCPYCGTELAGAPRNRLSLVVCTACKRPALLHPRVQNFACFTTFAGAVNGAICAHFLAYLIGLLGLLAVIPLMVVAEWLGFSRSGAIMEAMRSVSIMLGILIFAPLALETFLAVRTEMYVHVVRMPGNERGKAAKYMGMILFPIFVGMSVWLLWILLNSLVSLGRSLWQVFSV